MHYLFGAQALHNLSVTVPIILYSRLNESCLLFRETQWCPLNTSTSDTLKWYQSWVRGNGGLGAVPTSPPIISMKR